MTPRILAGRPAPNRQPSVKGHHDARIRPADFPLETLAGDLDRHAGIFQTWRRNSPDHPAEQRSANRMRED